MTAFKKIMLGIGLLCIGDTTLVLLLGGGANLGTLLPGMGGVLLVLWATLKPRSNLNFAFLHQRNFVMFVFLFACFGVLSFLVIQSLILFHAFGKDAPETDWCVVLGAGLRDEVPTLTLKKRLITAINYLNKYPDIKAIVSGGIGTGETITEAQAMSRYLVENGIARERIHLEEHSTSTFQNLRLSREIINGIDGGREPRVSIISSDFHLFRVWMLTRRLGINASLIPAPTPWYLLPNTCIREYFAVVKSFLLDR